MKKDNDNNVIRLRDKQAPPDEPEQGLSKTLHDVLKSEDQKRKKAKRLIVLGICVLLVLGIVATTIILLRNRSQRSPLPSEKKVEVLASGRWPWHYHVRDPWSKFPKEINDREHQKIYVHYDLTGEQASNNLTLFLDTLYAVHANAPNFTLTLKVGTIEDNLTKIGEVTFRSGGHREWEEKYVTIHRNYIKPGKNMILLENGGPMFCGRWLVWDSLALYDAKGETIWQIGENEAPPDYSEDAFDEFDQLT